MRNQCSDKPVEWRDRVFFFYILNDILKIARKYTSCTLQSWLLRIRHRFSYRRKEIISEEEQAFAICVKSSRKAVSAKHTERRQFPIRSAEYRRCDPCRYHIFLSWTQIAGCHGNLLRPEYRYQRTSTTLTKGRMSHRRLNRNLKAPLLVDIMNKSFISRDVALLLT